MVFTLWALLSGPYHERRYINLEIRYDTKQRRHLCTMKHHTPMLSAVSDTTQVHRCHLTQGHSSDVTAGLTFKLTVKLWKVQNSKQYLVPEYCSVSLFNDTVSYRIRLVSSSSLIQAWDWHCQSANSGGDNTGRHQLSCYIYSVPLWHMASY